MKKARHRRAFFFVLRRPSAALEQGPTWWLPRYFVICGGAITAPPAGAPTFWSSGVPVLVLLVPICVVGLAPSGMLALVPAGETGDVVTRFRGATLTLLAGDTVPFALFTVLPAPIEDGRFTAPVRGTVDPGDAAPKAPGVPTVEGGTRPELEPGDTEAPGTGAFMLPLELGPPVLPRAEPGTLLLRLPAEGAAGPPEVAGDMGLKGAAPPVVGAAGEIWALARLTVLPRATTIKVDFITLGIEVMSFS